MDDQELDDWFGEEREKLETTYMTGAEKRVEPEKLRAAFDKGFKDLVAQYQKKQAQIYATQRRQAAIQKPIHRFKENRDLAIRAIKDEWTLFIAHIKAWFFHQKIKRILRQR